MTEIGASAEPCMNTQVRLHLSRCQHVVICDMLCSSCTSTTNKHVPATSPRPPMPTQVQGHSSQAIARNCHVKIPFTAYSRTAPAGFVCLGSATLDLHQCTVVASAVSGSLGVPSRIDSSPCSELVCGVVLQGSESEHCTQPSTVNMADCSFSFQVPDAASTAGIRGSMPVGRAVFSREGSRLEATRCTFSGFGLDLKSHAAAHLTDCTIEGIQGGDGEGTQGWHMGLLCWAWFIS